MHTSTYVLPIKINKIHNEQYFLEQKIWILFMFIKQICVPKLFI